MRFTTGTRTRPDTTFHRVRLLDSSQAAHVFGDRVEGMMRSHEEPTHRFHVLGSARLYSGHLGRMAYSAHRVGAPIRVGADTAL